MWHCESVPLKQLYVERVNTIALVVAYLERWCLEDSKYPTVKRLCLCNKKKEDPESLDVVAEALVVTTNVVDADVLLKMVE